MSYVVASMMKLKSGNLTGIGNHNQRRFSNHSNTDIDKERTHLNYDLVNLNKPINYKTDIEKYINNNKSSNRATRKDAVLVNEWLISSDTEFFKKLSDEETKEYFSTVVDYFSSKFGKENIRYAQVHLDETTPHMHLGIVPFDKDFKLAAKRIFNRETLIKIQDELPIYLKERGFDIERGEKNSNRGHLSVEEYKKYSDQKKAMQKEIDTLTPKSMYSKNLNKLLNSIESEKRDTLIGNKVTLPKNEFNSLILALKSNIKREDKMKNKIDSLEKKLNNLETKNSNLINKYSDYDYKSQEIEVLSSKVNKLIDNLEYANNQIIYANNVIKKLPEGVWNKALNDFDLDKAKEKERKLEEKRKIKPRKTR